MCALGTRIVFWPGGCVKNLKINLKEQKKKKNYLGSASEYEQCMTTLKSKPKSQQAKVVHCSGKEQTKADSVWLQGRLMSPCNLTVLCTLRLPADTHAPRISQHSQMKTSRSRGSRSAVYLCLRVVRLRSSFCLLLWILLKDQGKIDIQWCVTWCRKQRRDNMCLWILRWGETKRPIHHFILIATAVLTSDITHISVLCSVHMSCSTCKCNSNVQFRLAAGAPTYPPRHLNSAEVNDHPQHHLQTGSNLVTHVPHADVPYLTVESAGPRQQVLSHGHRAHNP